MDHFYNMSFQYHKLEWTFNWCLSQNGRSWWRYTAATLVIFICRGCGRIKLGISIILKYICAEKCGMLKKHAFWCQKWPAEEMLTSALQCNIPPHGWFYLTAECWSLLVLLMGMFSDVFREKKTTKVQNLDSGHWTGLWTGPWTGL